MFKQKLEVIEFKMDGIPTVGDVITILSLEFVCSLTDNLGDFVRAFLGRTELASSWVFCVLVNLTQHPVSSLEGPSSNVLVIVLCYLLMVSCSLETSCVLQLITSIEVIIELLPISVLIKPLVY